MAEACFSAIPALPMPASSETLPVLEQRFAERLLAFERLGEARLSAGWRRCRAACQEKASPSRP